MAGEPAHVDHREAGGGRPPAGEVRDLGRPGGDPRKYRVTEISEVSTFLDVQEGELDGRNRLVVSNVPTGTTLPAAGHTVHGRTTISDITADSFIIEKEISTDGGREWSLAAKAVYTRAGAGAER